MNWKVYTQCSHQLSHNRVRLVSHRENSFAHSSPHLIYTEITWTCWGDKIKWESIENEWKF